MFPVRKNLWSLIFYRRTVLETNSKPHFPNNFFWKKSYKALNWLNFSHNNGPTSSNAFLLKKKVFRFDITRPTCHLALPIWKKKLCVENFPYKKSETTSGRSYRGKTVALSEVGCQTFFKTTNFVGVILLDYRSVRRWKN
jgi:hypothetical protein